MILFTTLIADDCLLTIKYNKQVTKIYSTISTSLYQLYKVIKSLLATLLNSVYCQVTTPLLTIVLAYHQGLVSPLLIGMHLSMVFNFFVNAFWSSLVLAVVVVFLLLVVIVVVVVVVIVLVVVMVAVHQGLVSPLLIEMPFSI